MRRLWIVLASIAATGCGEEPDPRPASFGYLHSAIFVPNCATIGCHSERSAQAGVDLESEEFARSALLARVVPMRPDSSLLISLLEGSPFQGIPLQTLGVTRMPPDAPLPRADVELVRRWIQEGALP